MTSCQSKCRSYDNNVHLLIGKVENDINMISKLIQYAYNKNILSIQPVNKFSMRSKLHTLNLTVLDQEISKILKLLNIHIHDTIYLLWNIQLYLKKAFPVVRNDLNCWLSLATLNNSPISSSESTKQCHITRNLQSMFSCCLNLIKYLNDDEFLSFENDINDCIDLLDRIHQILTTKATITEQSHDLCTEKDQPMQHGDSNDNVINGLLDNSVNPSHCDNSVNDQIFHEEFVSITCTDSSSPQCNSDFKVTQSCITPVFNALSTENPLDTIIDDNRPLIDDNNTKYNDYQIATLETTVNIQIPRKLRKKTIHLQAIKNNPKQASDTEITSTESACVSLEETIDKHGHQHSISFDRMTSHQSAKEIISYMKSLRESMVLGINQPHDDCGRKTINEPMNYEMQQQSKQLDTLNQVSSGDYNSSEPVNICVVDENMHSTWRPLESATTEEANSRRNKNKLSNWRSILGHSSNTAMKPLIVDNPQEDESDTLNKRRVFKRKYRELSSSYKEKKYNKILIY